MDKKLKWEIPTLTDLGRARRMSFGELGVASTCNKGTGATNCVGGYAVGTED